MKVVKVLFVVGALFGGIALVGGAQAMTYQDAVDVEFTLDPTLSISLSANALSIDNLVPGNSARSNTILVDVETNNVYGYALTAKVGGTMAGASESNDLVNGGSSFSSLATSDNLALADFNADTWGYTTASAINSSTTYSGLLYNADTTINMTTGVRGKSVAGYPGTNSTSFTIGASASESQLSGEYTNVISFTAVTNMATDFTIDDLKYMQDFANLTSGEKALVLESMTEDAQYQLIDSRDNKTYWVSKLKDGNVWMTQNLDFDLSSTATYTSEDTDLNEFGVNGYEVSDGYACSNTGTTNGCTAVGEIIRWTPERSTINAVITEDTSIAEISAWENDQDGPCSADLGDWYWSGTYYSSSSECPSTVENNYLGCNFLSKPDNNKWSTYFSTTPFTGVGTSNNGTHGHVGNYYNWSASVASNNSSFYTSSTLNDMGDNPKNSICPAGWRLPIITTYTSSAPYAAGTNEFYNLAYYYGGSSMSSDANMVASPLFFVRAGTITSKISRRMGFSGTYWSSTVSSASYTYDLYVNSGITNPQNEDLRHVGRSVRCMAR